MKLIKLNMLSLAFVLGSSLGFATLAIAQEDDSEEAEEEESEENDNDSEEGSCLNALKSVHDKDLSALASCVMSALSENTGDDDEVGAVEADCANEYAAAVVDFDEIKDCIEDQD